MDYKYIEQLLERYWQCDTTLEEEDILHTFFNQENVPAEFAEYTALFTYGNECTVNDALDDSFDERIMTMIDDSKPVKAKKVRLSVSLSPLFKAAAIVAMVVTIGNAAQFSFDEGGTDDGVNVVAGYKKAYTTGDPSVAYDVPQVSVDTLLNGVSGVSEPIN